MACSGCNKHKTALKFINRQTNDRSFFTNAQNMQKLQQPVKWSGDLKFAPKKPRLTTDGR